MEDRARRKEYSEIVEWIRKYVAMLLDIDVKEVDPGQRLEELGLDSLSGVTMVGELEDWLGVEIKPEEIKKCRTLADIARIGAGGNLAEDPIAP